MQLEIKTWLYDILNAIVEIESFIDDTSYTFESYQYDLKTKRAVERNIEIIGEAVNRIVQKDKLVTLSNSRQIIDTRNRIIHGYDSVSDQIIWGIVKTHLPQLRIEVEILLGE